MPLPPAALTRYPPENCLVSSEVPSPPETSHPTEQGIRQALTHLLTQHEKSCETLKQVITSNLQGFAKEQDKLRRLVESQHKEMLEKFTSLDQKTFLNQKATTAGSSLFSSSPLSKSDSNLPHKASDEIFVQGLPTMLTRALTGATPKSEQARELFELVDIHKLPLHWPTQRSMQHVDESTRSRGFAKLRRFVRSSAFDITMACVLMCNLASMCVEMEWRSYALAQHMGNRRNSAGWDGASTIFESIEFSFALIFFIELVLRCYVFSLRYLQKLPNALDSAIVSLSFVTACILHPIGIMEDVPKIATTRVFLLIRITRLFKVVRLTSDFSELRILARALTKSLAGLFWSFLILFFIITSAALFLFGFLVGYMEDESNPLQQRRWVYEHFGSVSLSIMAMVECTFTGSWFRYSRPLILEVNGYLAIFWVLYILCIQFAVMKLIGSLFLRQTLAVATSDAEKMTMIKLREKQRFAQQIRDIFCAADTSGDGKLSPAEFEGMLHDVQVGKLFEQLDLEVAEVATLYLLLAADTGEADFEEFLEGALKLKSSARTIDVIQLLNANQILRREIETVYTAVSQIHDVVGKLQGL